MKKNDPKPYNDARRPHLKWVVDFRAGGKRRRKFFETKREASTFIQVREVEIQNQGVEHAAFPTALRLEAQRAIDLLEPYGKGIMEAVEFYLPHLKAQNQTCSVEDLVAEMLRVKQADGASRRYLNDIRSRLGQFAETFTGRATSDIAGDEVDDWLRDLEGRKGQSISAVGRNNFRRLLIVAFNYAVSRGYCADNPAVTSAKAKEIEGTVGILSVKQTADLLAKADSELVPFLAIGAFAGLRRAELERLDWSEVDLAGGLIEVVASKAKSASRRFVKIRKNLKAWLNPYAIRSGNVTPKDFRQRLDDARVAATIGDWPNNALRHGFASYTLAAENDAAALALELGHTNSNLVFQHYRQIVKPKDAKAYWNITPSAEASGKVVAYLAC